MNHLDDIFLLCAMLFGFLSFLLLSQLLVMVWDRIARRTRIQGLVRRACSAKYTR